MIFSFLHGDIIALVRFLCTRFARAQNFLIRAKYHIRAKKKNHKTRTLIYYFMHLCIKNEDFFLHRIEIGKISMMLDIS